MVWDGMDRRRPPTDPLVLIAERVTDVHRDVEALTAELHESIEKLTETAQRLELTISGGDAMLDKKIALHAIDWEAHPAITQRLADHEMRLNAHANDHILHRQRIDGIERTLNDGKERKAEKQDRGRWIAGVWIAVAGLVVAGIGSAIQAVGNMLQGWFTRGS